jgi:PhzF family phenazine biosynthesis protein
MPLQFAQIDAFTNRPYAGNPAAVVVLPEPRPDAWLQAVAIEMNLSETAYLLPRGEGRFNLRWFTPGGEVNLCGHATLASAWHIWNAGLAEPTTTLRFETLSGELRARQAEGWIELDFPVEPASPVTPVEGLIEALGLTGAPVFVGANRMDELVVLASESQVAALRPDFARLRGCTRRGVIVTAPSSAPEYDFCSRFFAPALNIDEDPVTGSAHCCLGPYWAGVLGKSMFLAHQISARGGVLRVTMQGQRVLLAGQATPTIRGEILA